MFTVTTAYIISSLFGLVIVFSLSTTGVEKGIDLIKRLRD